MTPHQPRRCSLGVKLKKEIADSMNSSFEKLINDLRALGVRENGVLLVHSSLRALGPVEGGAETVCRALLEVLGERGTLLVPALSYETVTREHPEFDVRTTPTCIGALTEYFRRREGTLRSVHPTHSVCGVGHLVHDLLCNHELDTTPCGPNSPFHKLPSFEGQILMLGCGLRPNTSMHSVEELIEPPYLFTDPFEYTITDAAGRQFKQVHRRHNFDGWVQRYDRLADVLAEPDLRSGPVLQSTSYLIEAAAMRPAIYRKLQEDILYFVDREDAPTA